MTQGYAAFRENSVKTFGTKVVNDADALLDKHDAEPWVEVNDDTDGKRVNYKQSVAEKYIADGRASRPALYSFPSRLYSYKWDKIFGGKNG